MTGEPREWMVGLQGHMDLLTLSEVVRLIKGGQLRRTEMVKRGSDPWRTVSDFPTLVKHFARDSSSSTFLPAAESSEPQRPTVRPAAPKAAPQPEDRRSGSTSRIKKATQPIPKGTESEPARPIARAAQSRFRKSRILKASPEETAASPESRGVRDEERPRFTSPRTAVPSLAPMVSKYFSVTDLARHAALAFDRCKLLLAAAIVVPAFAAAFLILSFTESLTSEIAVKAVWIVDSLFVACAISFAASALALLTRRALEGDPARTPGPLTYAKSRMIPSIAFPLISLAPALAGIVALGALGFLRNSSPAMASMFKAAYALFFGIGLVTVAGGILYLLAVGYLPSAMAVDALPLGDAFHQVFRFVRRQPSRFALHGMGILVSVAASAAVLLYLTMLAFGLPEILFGPPADPDVAANWTKFGTLQSALFGAACGLALVLPVSILSTFGTLSYLTLKQEDVEYDAAPPGETSGGSPDAPSETPPPETKNESDEPPDLPTADTPASGE